jgi:hypothetical protein
MRLSSHPRYLYSEPRYKMATPSQQRPLAASISRTMSGQAIVRPSVNFSPAKYSQQTQGSEFSGGFTRSSQSSFL